VFSVQSIFGQTVDGTAVSEREKSAFRDIECDSFGTASPGVRDQKSAAPSTASIVRQREAILGKAPEKRAMRVGKTRRDSKERRSAQKKTGLRIAPTAHLLPRDGEKPCYIPHLKIEMWATQLFGEGQMWATPPILAQRPLIAKNAMNGAQILFAHRGSSGAMTGPPAIVEHVAYLPGPQMQGTGGTLNVVWKSHRDRGHPPILAQRPLIAKNAMNGAQLLFAHRGSSGAMTGPPAFGRN
jgi:hypothetical protein